MKTVMEQIWDLLDDVVVDRKHIPSDEAKRAILLLLATEARRRYEQERCYIARKVERIMEMNIKATMTVEEDKKGHNGEK